MNKYLRISFTNAKLFPNNKLTKDFIGKLDKDSKNNFIYTRSKRKDEEVTSFNEPITVYQVSNMLHSLICERPIPSFREVFYSHDKELFDIANSSFIKIDSPKVVDSELFFLETTKINKSAYDAYATPSDIQWFKVKKYMGELFDDFIILISDALGYNVLSKKCNHLLHINQDDIYDFTTLNNFLNKNKKTPIINMIGKAKYDANNSIKKFDISEITKSPVIGETVLSDVDNVSFINGSLIVPLNEYLESRIVKNTTNILDGGYVKIEQVVNEYDIYNIYEYIKVSEISTLKI